MRNRTLKSELKNYTSFNSSARLKAGCVVSQVDSAIMSCFSVPSCCDFMCVVFGFFESFIKCFSIKVTCTDFLLISTKFLNKILNKKPNNLYQVNNVVLSS